MFIVDADPDVRQALVGAVAALPLAAEAFVDADAALAGIHRDRPGCVVLDLQLGNRDGLGLIEALRDRGVLLPIIIIAGAANVPTAVQALRAGVFDFFEKPVSAPALIERVQAAIAEDATKRPGSRRLLDFAGRVARLTRREREVMALVIAGGSSRTIASTLALSPKTVETHRAKVMAKTGVSSLAELIRLALIIEFEAGGLAADPAAAYGTRAQGGSRR